MQGDNIPSPTANDYEDSGAWDSQYASNTEAQAQAQAQIQAQGQRHRLAMVPTPTHLGCGLKRHIAGKMFVDALKQCSGQELISYISERNLNAETGISRITVTDEAAIAVSAAVTDVLHFYVQQVKRIFHTDEDQKMHHTKASLEAALLEFQEENPAIKRLLSPPE